MSPEADLKFMTVEEVARALRVSTMTVYRLLKGADCPLQVVRVGRSIRITRESFVKMAQGER